MSNEEFKALHDRAQDSLNRYVTTNRAWRRIEQRQRLLLHMMDNDSQFLLTSIDIHQKNFRVTQSSCCLFRSFKFKISNEPN